MQRIVSAAVALDVMVVLFFLAQKSEWAGQAARNSRAAPIELGLRWLPVMQSVSSLGVSN